jgi:hypothetical protein
MADNITVLQYWKRHREINFVGLCAMRPYGSIFVGRLFLYPTGRSGPAATVTCEEEPHIGHVPIHFLSGKLTPLPFIKATTYSSAAAQLRTAVGYLFGCDDTSHLLAFHLSEVTTKARGSETKHATQVANPSLLEAPMLTFPDDEPRPNFMEASWISSLFCDTSDSTSRHNVSAKLSPDVPLVFPLFARDPAVRGLCDRLESKSSVSLFRPPSSRHESKRFSDIPPKFRPFRLYNVISMRHTHAFAL